MSIKFDKKLQKLFDNYHDTKKDIEGYHNLDKHLHEVNIGISLLDDAIRLEKKSLNEKELHIAKNMLLDLRILIMQRMQ